MATLQGGRGGKRKKGNNNQKSKVPSPHVQWITPKTLSWFTPFMGSPPSILTASLGPLARKEHTADQAKAMMLNANVERRFLLRTFYLMNKLTNTGEGDPNYLPLFNLQVDGDEWTAYREKIPTLLPAFNPDHMIRMYAEVVGQKAYKDGRKSLDKFSVPEIFEMAIIKLVQENPVVDVTGLTGDFIPTLLQDNEKVLAIRRWGRTWIFINANSTQLMTYAPDLFKYYHL